MKTCGFENQISPYLDGELSGAKLRTFEEHLSGCTRCRKQVEQFREMLSKLASMGDREVPPMLPERLHAALSYEILKGDGRVRRRKAWPWVLSSASAAVVIGVVGLAVLLGGNQTSKAQMLANQAAGAGFTTSAGAGPELMPAVTAAAVEAPMPAPTEAPAALAPATNGNGDTKYNLNDKLTHDAYQAASVDSAAQTGNTPETGGKMLVYTATVVEETRNFDAGMSQLNNLLAKYGGYVESSQVNGVPEGYENVQGRSATMALRIPVDQYRAAMADLKALGNMLNFTERTEDVSLQYVDTKARKDTLVEQRDQYRKLLEKAVDTDSIVTLTNQITDLTVQIEQDEAQMRLWQNQVSYSTVSVELRELVLPKSVEPSKTDMGSRATGAFYTTLNNMKKGLEDIAVWFVGFLPWLAILAVIAGVAAAITIPAVRRHRKAALKKAAEEKNQEDHHEHP